MRIESENVDVGDIFKFQVMIIKSETRTTGLVTTSQSGDHNSEGETVSLALGGSVKPELLGAGQPLCDRVNVGNKSIFSPQNSHGLSPFSPLITHTNSFPTS